MKTQLGVGIVGLGFVGRGAHVPAIANIADAKLAAVADPDAKRRERVQNKYAVGAAYASHEELIADPDVDLVIVAVPTQLHAPVARAALDAGKHVLCEMPLAVNLEDADELIDGARRKGVVLMPSLTFRFAPPFTRVRRMIAEGAIGTPVCVRYREFIPAKDLASQWPPSAWMWNLEESGGPLFTLAVWSIDLVRWITDSEIDMITAVATYTPLEHLGTVGYDATAAVRLQNGISGSLEYSGSVSPSAARCSLEIVGDTTNVLVTSDNDRVTLYGDDPCRTEWNVRQSGPRMWGHEQQDEHLIRCIRNGETPAISPEDGRRAMELARVVAGE